MESQHTTSNAPKTKQTSLLLLFTHATDQQEINEVIMRDINRTFPEHPFFGSAGGQNSLFRLLKAYSLQDVEVGYCQVRACACACACPPMRVCLLKAYS